MPNPLYFEEHILNNGIDTSEFQDVIQALRQREYQRVNLKPVKGSPGYFRVKTNRKGRVILTTLSQNGRNYLVVVEHLKNHKYETSKALNSGVELNPADFADQFEESDSNDSSEELTSEHQALFQSLFQEADDAFTPKKAFSYEQKYIALSDEQHAIRKHAAPLIIGGLFGSGKTVLLYEILLDFILQNPLMPETSSASTTITHQNAVGFYVAMETRLVKSVKTDWDESPSVPKDDHRIHFLSYREFAERQDPSLTNKKVVGLQEFIEWAHKRVGTLNARSIYKDLRFVSICHSFEDYQKVGVRNLHYHQPEDMQKIWDLYQDYKAYLGNVFVDWAFTQFEIKEQCDILCVDETQDLSLIQIIQLILSAKNNQFYIAMDINQSLFLDASIRPLMNKLLMQRNYNVIPTQVFLRANHRMPQTIAEVAKRLMCVRNHLMRGELESQGSFSITDIQGNGRLGHVTFILKPSLKDKKPTLPVSTQQTLADSEEYLRQIARHPGTAFIVPNETVRAEVIATYAATQVFLDREAKGLQWENVIAVEMIGQSDQLNLFEKGNNSLPLNATDLKLNPHRAPDKDDNSKSEYNSAFASPLVAITRSTENLILIETYSRNINRLLGLLHQAISPIAPQAKQAEPVKATRDEWKLQIKKLIANDNLNQAILAARQELSLTVTDLITAEELLAALEAPKSIVVAVETKTNKKIPKSKSKAVAAVTAQPDLAVTTTKRERQPVGKLSATALQMLIEDDLITNQIEELCRPNHISRFIKLLDNQKLKIKLAMLNHNVIANLHQSPKLAAKVLDKIFKNNDYFVTEGENVIQFFCIMVNNVMTMNWIQSLPNGTEFISKAYTARYNYKHQEEAKLPAITQEITADKITPRLLQTYLNGISIPIEKPIAQLCQPKHIEHFIQLLSSPELEKSSFSLSMLMADDALIQLHSAGKLGVDALALIFKANHFYTKEPDLMDIFINGEVKNVTWLMSTSYGIKFLYELLDQSEFACIRVIYQLKNPISLSALDAKLPFYEKRSEYVLRQLAGENNPQREMVDSVLDSAITLLSTLLSAYHQKFSKFLQFKGNDVEIVGDFIKYLHVIFSSREFKRIFFLSTSSFPSLFLRILANDQCTELFQLYLEKYSECKKLFNQYFYLNCLMRIELGQQPAGEFLELSQRCAWFLISNIEPDNLKNVFNVEDVSMLINAQRSEPSANLLAFVIAGEILSHKNQFFFLLRGCHPTVLAKFMKITFRNAAAIPIESTPLISAAYGLVKKSKDMIGLLSESIIGCSLLYDYLELFNDTEFAGQLIHKLLNDLAQLKSGRQFYFLKNITGGGLLSLLARKHPDLFQAVRKQVDILQQLNLKNADKVFLNLFDKLNETESKLLFQSPHERYYLTYYDSRAGNILQLAKRYSSIRLVSEESSVPLTFSYPQHIIPEFSLIYLLLIDNGRQMRNISGNTSLFCQLANYLFQNPHLVAAKNIPLKILIDNPFEASLYSTLILSNHGCCLLKYLFALRAFSLQSIDAAQLHYSIRMSHQYQQNSDAISLFFILTVTAGEAGHQHLLELLRNYLLIISSLTRSDLVMQDNSNVFPDASLTPESELSKTETGKKILKLIQEKNPAALRSNAKPVATTPFWQASDDNSEIPAEDSKSAAMNSNP